MTAGEGSGDDEETLRELARLRTPAIVYLLDAAFSVTFSSDGTPPGPLPAQVDLAVQAIRPSLEAGEPAAAALGANSIVRGERLIGTSNNTGYVIFVEQVV